MGKKFTEPGNFEATEEFKERYKNCGFLPTAPYRQESPMFIQQHFTEFLEIQRLVELTKPLGGVMAEVGVCEGGSAWVIRDADTTNRPFYLFDTFEGLPGLNKFSFADALMKPIDIVKNDFKSKTNMFFHKGLFPMDTGRYVEHLRFSFVHLDVDIYRSMKDCLGFFYNRMLPGGVLLCHDYNEPNWGEQINRAVDEFYLDKPETLVKTCERERYLPNTQVYIIKGKAEEEVKLTKDNVYEYIKRKEMEGAW